MKKGGKAFQTDLGKIRNQKQPRELRGHKCPCVAGG